MTYECHRCCSTCSRSAGRRGRRGAGKCAEVIGGCRADAFRDDSDRPIAAVTGRAFPRMDRQAGTGRGGQSSAARQSRFSASMKAVSVSRRGRAAWKRNLSEGRGGKSPPAVPRSPPRGDGAEAVDGAGGRGARGGRRARPAAPRGRGAARAVARSPSQGCRSPGSAATLQAPQKDGTAARRSRPARPASAVRSPSAEPATIGGRAPPAPRGRAGPTRAPAAQRRATVPDGAPGAAGAVPRSLPAAGVLRLREVLSRLTLDRQDVSKASQLVNQVTLKLTEAIRSHGGSFSSIEQLGAGSYYEHVKISEPNEFDIMLVIPIERLQLEPSDDTGAFYYLTFKRNPKEKALTKFVNEDERLSASKMLDALREIIKQVVKSIPDVDVTVKRKKPGSPAITLQITNHNTEPPAEISVDIILTLKVNQSWPPSTLDGLKIEQWLGRKVRRNYRVQPLYLVAKQNKREKVQRGDYWRLSFSHIEKLMMNNHGNTKTCCESDGAKCCRKACLKLMKYLLEKLKLKYPERLEKISSYYVKTSFFHSCAKWPADTDWPVAGLEDCFQRSLAEFLDCLQRSHLPHFFVPQYNLLGPEDKASSEFLSRQMQLELNNRFPIFLERS